MSEPFDLSHDMPTFGMYQEGEGAFPPHLALFYWGWRINFQHDGEVWSHFLDPNKEWTWPHCGWVCKHCGKCMGCCRKILLTRLDHRHAELDEDEFKCHATGNIHEMVKENK